MFHLNRGNPTSESAPSPPVTPTSKISAFPATPDGSKKNGSKKIGDDHS